MFVISINLAVLWGLFTKFVPEHIVKMARSVVSLASSGSRGSNSSTHSRSRHDTRRGSSIKMETIYSGNTGSSFAEATHDVDVPPVPEVQKSHILVNESVQVSSTEAAREHV